MLNDILKDISEKSKELVGISNSYQYFYRVIICDDSLRNALSGEEVNEIMVKLNLSTIEIFIEAASNGHKETLGYIFNITLDNTIKETLNNYGIVMAFVMASQYSYFEVMKYLVELVQDIEIRDRMIHAYKDLPFILNAAHCNIDEMRYLLSLTKEEETRKNMIHAGNDYAFSIAVTKGNTKLMKYFAVLDPFYGWPEQACDRLKYYKHVNIAGLKNIATTCKNLFSALNKISAKVEANYNIRDLPTEIINIILTNLAQTTEDRNKEVCAVIKAFTFEDSTYSGGFHGFTIRYEEALKEIGAIDIVE